MAVDPADRDPGRLAERRRLLDRLLAGEGAGFIVHDLPVRSDGRTVASESRPWPVDPLPYHLSAADFAWIEGAVSRRMRMLDDILRDLHGERRLVAEGVVDPALLWGSPRYRLAAASGWGRPAGSGRWLSTYAADGSDLDAAMDRVQVALARLGGAIAERYLIVPDA